MVQKLYPHMSSIILYYEHVNFTGTQTDGQHTKYTFRIGCIHTMYWLYVQKYTNKWYNSIPLAECLLSVHKLTLVGTLRNNKKEIPPEFLNTKLHLVNFSMFMFRSKLCLVSYSEKKNRNPTIINNAAFR